MYAPGFGSQVSYVINNTFFRIVNSIKSTKCNAYDQKPGLRGQR